MVQVEPLPQFGRNASHCLNKAQETLCPPYGLAFNLHEAAALPPFPNWGYLVSCMILKMRTLSKQKVQIGISVSAAVLTFAFTYIFKLTFAHELI